MRIDLSIQNGQLRVALLEMIDGIDREVTSSSMDLRLLRDALQDKDQQVVAIPPPRIRPGQILTREENEALVLKEYADNHKDSRE